MKARRGERFDGIMQVVVGAVLGLAGVGAVAMVSLILLLVWTF